MKNLKTTRTITLFFAAIVGWGVLVADEAGAAAVKSEHPRIWLNPAAKLQLIIDLSPGGRFANYYTRIKAYVDSNPSYGGNAYGVRRYWLSVLLCAMVEVDGNAYIVKAKNQIQEFKNNSGAVYSEFNAVTISFIYDWLYDDLTVSEKQDVSNFLVSWWNYWNSTAYFHDSWNNHTMEEIGGFVFGSLAIYGDGYQDAAAAQNLLVAKNWLNEIITATNLAAGSESSAGIDGGWAEGQYYCGRGGYAFLEDLYAWSTATDENILNDSISMANLGVWLFYINRGDNTFAQFGDGVAETEAFPEPGMSNVLLYELSSLYYDRYARYIWNRRVGSSVYGNSSGVLNVSGSMLSVGYSSFYTYYVLFNNNTDPVDPSTLNKTAYFDGMDMVVERTGFGSNDTVFIYKNNDRMTGHDHNDAGHFEISRSKGLAIDSGAYEGGDTSPNRHDTKYYQRTIAHNTITVYDPSEIWDDYYSRWTTNDGGQKWPGEADGANRPDRYSDFMSSARWDRGGIESYESNNDYTYFLADVSPAYARSDGSDLAITHSRKLENFYREVAYVGNKYWVMFDSVKSTDASFVKRWLLHTVDEPVVEGSLITVDNSGSRLYIKNLLSQTISKRGGSGFEYWTNYDDAGENPIFNTQYFGKTPNEPGSWRIEISPSLSNLQDYFLNVLYPTDTSTMVPEIAEIFTREAAGVHIKDATENIVVIFEKNDTGEGFDGALTYSIIPSTVRVRHYLYNLPANTKFVISVTSLGHNICVIENPDGSHSSTIKGTLEFTTTNEDTYPHKGDLNSDGKVDITDVQACVNHILGAQDYGTKADVNSDGSVNVQDVQMIVNTILGN